MFKNETRDGIDRGDTKPIYLRPSISVGGGFSEPDEITLTIRARGAEDTVYTKNDMTNAGADGWFILHRFEHSGAVHFEGVMRSGENYERTTGHDYVRK